MMNNSEIRIDQFKLLHEKGENVVFPSSSAEVFERALANDEIILINKRNDPLLNIKPVEEILYDEIRNILISPIHGKISH